MGRLRVRGSGSDPVEQTIAAIDDSEVEWIELNLQAAEALVRASVGAEASRPLELVHLDQAFETWLEYWCAQPEHERDDPNLYINAFGIAFGQRLVDDLGFAWKVVTDADGTEIAVVGQPGDQVVFPPNLVAKRFVARETGFMAPLFDEIAKISDELRRGGQPSA